MAEKLCLQCNDFKNNIAIQLMRLGGTDFSDVTLACENGQQLEAHNEEHTPPPSEKGQQSRESFKATTEKQMHPSIPDLQHQIPANK